MEKYEYQIEKESVPWAIGEQIMDGFFMWARGKCGFCLGSGGHGYIYVCQNVGKEDINVMYVRVHMHL